MPDSLQDYWDDRAARLGPRAVLHIKHPPDAMDEVTHRHFYEVFDRVDPLLTGQENTALDFGCGAGRLTPLLTQRVHGPVLGVDPTKALVESAPVSNRVDYVWMDSHEIPLQEGVIDLVFVFGVLGAIPDDQLTKTINELERVRDPDGQLILVENTTTAPNAPHWFFRSVDDYLGLFSHLNLQHLGDYEEFGETMSIFSGPRRPRNSAMPRSGANENSGDEGDGL
ncbi:MAG: class I SAM-dependent methyltransferase [Planctomycetota bacterium]